MPEYRTTSTALAQSVSGSARTPATQSVPGTARTPAIQRSSLGRSDSRHQQQSIEYNIERENSAQMKMAPNEQDNVQYSTIIRQQLKQQPPQINEATVLTAMLASDQIAGQLPLQSIDQTGNAYPQPVGHTGKQSQQALDRSTSLPYNPYDRSVSMPRNMLPRQDAVLKELNDVVPSRRTGIPGGFR